MLFQKNTIKKSDSHLRKQLLFTSIQIRTGWFDCFLGKVASIQFSKSEKMSEVLFNVFSMIISWNMNYLYIIEKDSCIHFVKISCGKSQEEILLGSIDYIHIWSKELIFTNISTQEEKSF
jgi:hypothetical protein